MENKNQDFENDYINHYIKKIKKIREKYPIITEESRRTGKTLKTICFFIWSYAKEEDDSTIDLLLRSSVLLAAQDDFYDSLNISNDKKEKFYSTCANLIKGKKYHFDGEDPQCKELVSLWREINQEVKNTTSHLYSYWQEKALELNGAMLKENDIIHQKNVTFNEYIKISTNSVGIMFIWATYFTKKKITNTELNKIKKILFTGAEVTRLNNDIASYRREDSEMNAISMVKYKKSPKKYILNLIKREHHKFDDSISNIKLKTEIKQALIDSVNFLEIFYKKSDFK